jgi:competence protein ComEA
LFRHTDPPAIELHPPPTLAPTDTPAPTATPLPTPTPAPITIYVSGAVQKPGLYQLSAEARVGDAIASAGGLTTAANGDLINQAEKLWDGAQIHVPSQGEAAAKGAPPVGVSGDQPAPATRGGVAIDPNAAAPNATGKVNINSASAEELDALPGIGLSRAQAIIANRPYATVDELDKVPGIGASMIERLRPLVTTQ